jgi:hypothetical protein
MLILSSFRSGRDYDMGLNTTCLTKMQTGQNPYATCSFYEPDGIIDRCPISFFYSFSFLRSPIFFSLFSDVRVLCPLYGTAHHICNGIYNATDNSFDYSFFAPQNYSLVRYYLTIGEFLAPSIDSIFRTQSTNRGFFFTRVRLSFSTVLAFFSLFLLCSLRVLLKPRMSSV